MINRALLLAIICISYALAGAQNVGIGIEHPGSKLSVKGGISIGENYASQTAPDGSIIIEKSMGIGTSVIDTNVVLDIKSTTKGVLFPTMSNSQINSIVNPPKGLFVFNSDSSGFNFYNGTSWLNFALFGPTGPVGQTLNLLGLGGSSSSGAYNATSVSLNSIGTGTKVFVASSGKSYQANDRVRISYNSSNYMEGVVTTYLAGVLTVNVDRTVGSGTYLSWKIGITGDAGADGPKGATGATGATGTNGVAGAKGATGATGAAGVNGTNGADGAKGATGATGAAGINGTNGVTGATGPTGAAGVNGTNGINGATGAKGATGATGATGAAGVNGTNGADGLKGATGATGATGITGPTGNSNGWSLTGNSGTTPGTNYIGTSDSKDLIFKTNGTEKLRIQSNGQIGIGCTSVPSNKWMVASNVTNPTFTSAGNGLGTCFAGGGGFYVKNQDDGVEGKYESWQGKIHLGVASGTPAPLVFYTEGSTESARLDENGNFGIGISSPSQKLDVADGNIIISNSTNSAGQLRFQEPSNSGSNYTAFKAQAQSSNITYTLPNTDGSNGQVLTTDGSGSLSWVTASSNSGTSASDTYYDKGDGVTSISSTSTWTTISGLSRTVSTSGSGKLVISTAGGFETTSTSNSGYSAIEIAIYVDGTRVNGGYQRSVATNTSGYKPNSSTWSMSVVVSVSSGSHTVQVKAIKDSGSTADVSEDNSSPFQGSLVTQVVY